MLKLYDYLPSQNAWKVRLLLNHLGIEHETVPVSIFEGAGQTADFCKRNPIGAVPVLELDDGRTLPESNAILVYLAENTPYLPTDRWQRAQVLRWMFFEQDQVQPGIASLRYRRLTGKLAADDPMAARLRKRSQKTLAVLNAWLADHAYLAGDYSIADMAVFAYVAFADDAGLPLEDYPQVSAWIERVRAQPGFLATVHPYSSDLHSANELP